MILTTGSQAEEKVEDDIEAGRVYVVVYKGFARRPG